jgi:hypothetical protein
MAKEQSKRKEKKGGSVARLTEDSDFAPSEGLKNGQCGGSTMKSPIHTHEWHSTDLTSSSANLRRLADISYLRVKDFISKSRDILEIIDGITRSLSFTH